jgi:hypothetical protein
VSTKIYTAWRVPARLFAETFLPRFRTHCLKKAAAQVRKIAPILSSEEVASAFRGKGGYDLVWPGVTAPRVRAVLHLAREASRSAGRDATVCLDCSVNCWLFKGRFYVIPYGEPWLYESFVAPAGAESYEYWNNTDRPDDVPAAAWAVRKRMWDAVCLNDWDGRRLVHTVVDASRRVGLDAVARAVSPKVAHMCMPL